MRNVFISKLDDKHESLIWIDKLYAEEWECLPEMYNELEGAAGVVLWQPKAEGPR